MWYRLSYILDKSLSVSHTHTLVAEVSPCTLTGVVRWRSPPPPPSGTSNCVCQLSIEQKIVCMKKHYVWRWRGIKKVTRGGWVASGVEGLESVGWTAARLLLEGRWAASAIHLSVFSVYSFSKNKGTFRFDSLWCHGGCFKVWKNVCTMTHTQVDIGKSIWIYIN